MKKTRSENLVFNTIPAAGVEPARPNGHWILRIILIILFRMTIAIEDSYSGIQVSTSVGIDTIGYYDYPLPLFNAKANWKAGSMQEVLNVIQSQHEF